MKIIIIEDEITIRNELKILLENAGYETVAPECFSDITEQIIKEAPDLILLDVNLPGISGFDICTQLRGKTEVPVIFLTSRTDSMDELTGILRGADDYIAKPYQVPILLARIAAVLKRTKGIREATSFTRKEVIFVCVAVIVLSVQQLSDSAKYKFRYEVLGKMGLKQKEICKIIRIQLAAYYLCPAFLAIVISGKLILTFSSFFVRTTGVATSFPGIYFGKSILLFMGIYIVYYIVTYVVFKRNVFLKKIGA